MKTIKKIPDLVIVFGIFIVLIMFISLIPFIINFAPLLFCLIVLFIIYKQKNPKITTKIYLIVLLIGLFIQSFWSLFGNDGATKTTNQQVATTQRNSVTSVVTENTDLEVIKAEYEKLKKLIADAQTINTDLPEEVDGTVTDLNQAKTANLAIANTNNSNPSGNVAGINTTNTTIYKVLSVVDGDTIKIETIGTLRLIGIDTPEIVDPRKPVQCFALEASNKAKELLNGKKVYLEFDTSQGRMDKYGRTLAYVFREDGLFFNKVMISDGYAFEYTYNTPYKYQTEFKNAAKNARELLLGLWSAKTCSGQSVAATTGPTSVPVPIYTNKPIVNAPNPAVANPVPTAVPTQASGSWQCDCKRTCTQITTCEEAQYQLNTCGCKVRDGDSDGIACDGDPLHCQN